MLMKTLEPTVGCVHANKGVLREEFLVGSRLKCPGGRMGGRGPGEGEEEAGCEPG